jgi:hypothetical protein
MRTCFNNISKFTNFIRIKILKSIFYKIWLYIKCWIYIKRYSFIYYEQYIYFYKILSNLKYNLCICLYYDVFTIIKIRLFYDRNLTRFDLLLNLNN